jgi:hypothetical protein
MPICPYAPEAKCDFQKLLRRRSLGWVNDYSISENIDIFEDHDFTYIRQKPWGGKLVLNLGATIQFQYEMIIL